MWWCRVWGESGVCMVRIVSRAEQQKNTTESKTAKIPIRYALDHLKKKGPKLKKKNKSMKQQQQQIEAEVGHTLACELCAPVWIHL
jgi:hypothetical protein